MKILFVSSFVLACAMANPAASARQWRDEHGLTPYPGVATAPGDGMWTAREHLAQNNARGMDYNVYIRLKVGTSEGELLSRAGRPDSESVENIKDNIVKTYYYLPTASDPYITTVKLQAGSITSIERIRKN